MKTVALRHVGIRYQIGDLKGIGLKEYVLRRLTGRYHVKNFWADKDISFCLRSGDTLGIIGANGAGKSTLLKVISGILRPTHGKIKVRGNITSLVRPDILILDEVLSVGDAGFKAKSAAKMKEMMSGGVTTILVSHSIGQVRKLCNKVLWLHKGRQIAFSKDVKGTCDLFEKFLAKEIPLPQPDPKPDENAASETGIPFWSRSDAE